MTSTTLSRRLAAATCGLAALLSSVAIAAPASAEVFSSTDPAGDVAGVSAGQQPGVKQGDIRQVRFEHARSTITVRAGYRALDKVGPGIQQYVQISTPTGNYYIAALATPGNWRGQVLTLGDDCLGAEIRFNYRKDVFTMSVPRACAGNPRWVRVGLVTYAYTTEGDSTSNDDALRNGFDFETGEIALSPRLSRAGGSYTG